MKKILALMLLFVGLITQLFAQSPTDDNPVDPFGIEYQSGYTDGASEAIILKILLADTYGGLVDFIEIHEFDADQPYFVGPIASSSYTGLKVPVVVWQNVPSGILLQNPEVLDALIRLDQARPDGSYAEGYYSGFNDHIQYGEWN